MTGPTPRPSMNIHIVTGEKGGIGKTFFARLLVGHFLAADTPCAVVDTDISSPVLSWYYPDLAHQISLRTPGAADQIADLATEHAHVVVDLAANSAIELQAWAHQVDLISTCRQEGIRLRFWNIINDDPFTLVPLAQHLGFFKPNAVTHVIVKNCGNNVLGFTDAWEKHFRSTNIAQEIARHDIPIFQCPKLDPNITDLVNGRGSRPQPLHLLATDTSIGAFQRTRLRLYMKATFPEIGRIVRGEPADATQAA